MRNFSLCKTAIMVVLPAFILLIALTAGASMPVTSSESSAPSKLLAPGTAAPVCRLNGTNGTAWDFPAAGQWNIIVYWSLFCHSCLEEIPEIQHRIASMTDVKTFFVSLDTEKMLKALQNYCNKRELKLPVLMEQVASDTWVTADQYGVVSTPAVFIVAPDGKVAYSHEGPMDLDQFFAGFAAMVASSTTKPAIER